MLSGCGVSAKVHSSRARKPVTLAVEDKVKRLEVMLQYTRVSAPFSGVVLKRYVDPGNMIHGGTASSLQALPLVRLGDVSSLRLAIMLTEIAVSQVKVGSPVAIRILAIE